MTTFSYSSARADVNPLPSPFETLNGGGLRVISNAIKSSTSGAVSGYLESVENFSDDQFCEIAYSGTSSGDNPGVGVRCHNSGGLTGYIAFVNSGDNRVYVQKYVAGTPTSIAFPVETLASPLRIEVVTVGGNAQISVTQNGVHITGSPFTDSSSPITGGQPAAYYDNGNTRGTAITNISGGDLSSATTISSYYHAQQ